MVAERSKLVTIPVVDLDGRPPKAGVIGGAPTRDSRLATRESLPWERLPDDQVLVLSHLPIAPTLLSIGELADGILNGRSPAQRARLMEAVQGLDGFLPGGLQSAVMRDDFGRICPGYAIPRRHAAAVAIFLASIELP